MKCQYWESTLIFWFASREKSSADKTEVVLIYQNMVKNVGLAVHLPFFYICDSLQYLIVHNSKCYITMLTPILLQSFKIIFCELKVTVPSTF